MSSVIAFQKQGEYAIPFSEEDINTYSEFLDNQVSLFKLTTKGSSVKKQRSFKQFKLFHAAIRVVVANTEDLNWNTVGKAKLSLKAALNYVDEDVTVYDERKRQVIVKWRSFGYDGLKHMEACDVFNRSWPILADVIGIDMQTLIEKAKKREYPRGLR